MTTYYIQENEQIVLYDTDKQRLADTLLFKSELNGLPILETENIIVDGIMYTEEEWEAEQARKERERLDLLQLTKADVLLALYENKGLTPENIKQMLADNVPALIKFDYASSYYRGDDVVNALGSALGYSTDDMDYLFENKTFPPKLEEK